MKRLYSILFLLFISVVAFTQPYETNTDFNRTRNWHFGHGVGLRFDPDTIYEVSTSIHTHEAATVHTDADGNLLLYSNGEIIWDSNHQVIHNGNLSLGHHSSNLGSVFVFHEDNPDSIYLFNTYYNISSTKEFSMNLIVKEADTFRIVYKDSVLMYSVCEPIAVVKASNGKDIWITVQEFGANNFYSFLFTSNGIVKCPVASKSLSTPNGSPQAAYFTMVFSFDGRYMAKVNTNQEFPIIRKVEVYSFNSDNGKFNTLFSIDSLAQTTGGICFSRDNTLLYITERDDDLLCFKFNPSDSLSTINSKKKIKMNGLKSKMQLMPFDFGVALMRRSDDFFDSQIDFLTYNNDLDSIIVDERKINTNSATNFVFPNFNQNYFYSPSINFAYEPDCITNKVQFNGQDTFNANIHDWFITRQGSNPLTSSIKNPLVEFEDTGIYTIRYIASNGSRSDTIIKEAFILPKIEKNFLGSDINWCSNIDTTLTLNAPTGMHCYEWNTGETTQEITVSSRGTYIVKITTPNFCVIYDTINIQVNNAPPTYFLGEDTSWCESENNSLVLNALDNMQSYLWQDSSTGQTFEANQTGSYYVTITDSNGCISSDTIQIFIDSIPSIPSNFLGDYIAWCENTDMVITLTAPIGNYFYSWNTGSNNNQIQTDSTGVYSVVVSTLDGYCSIADSIFLYTFPQPLKPQIYQANDTLKTDALSNGYIWFRNNTIVGTNQDFLKLTDTGIYSLKVINDFACENTSDTLHVYKLNRNEIALSPILIYPNPFNNKILVESDFEIREVRIINALGQLVYHNNVSSMIKNIETSNFESGLYIIVIRDHNQNIYTYKLIKQSE